MNGAGWAEQKIGVNRRLSAAIQLSRSILLAADEHGSTPIAHSGLFEPDGALGGLRIADDVSPAEQSSRYLK